SIFRRQAPLVVIRDSLARGKARSWRAGRGWRGKLTGGSEQVIGGGQVRPGPGPPPGRRETASAAIIPEGDPWGEVGQGVEQKTGIQADPVPPFSLNRSAVPSAGYVNECIIEPLWPASRVGTVSWTPGGGNPNSCNPAFARIWDIPGPDPGEIGDHPFHRAAVLRQLPVGN